MSSVSGVGSSTLPIDQPYQPDPVLPAQTSEPEDQKAEISFAAHATWRLIKESGKGAILGYAGYWAIRVGQIAWNYLAPLVSNFLSQKISPRLSFFATPVAYVTNPLAFVVAGIAYSLVSTVIVITYQVALKILGNRQDYQDHAATTERSRLDRFRAHCWKAISCVEGVFKKVDEVYSKIFRIRTHSAIREQQIKEKNFFICDQKALEKDFAIMEIVRAVFINYVKSVIGYLLGTTVPSLATGRIVRHFFGSSIANLPVLGNIAGWAVTFFKICLVSNLFEEIALMGMKINEQELLEQQEKDDEIVVFLSKDQETVLDDADIQSQKIEKGQQAKKERTQTNAAEYEAKKQAARAKKAELAEARRKQRSENAKPTSGLVSLV